MLAHVLGAGMAQRDRGIHRLASQHEANSAADGDASAEHADLFAVQVNVVGFEQFDHASRSAWQRSSDLAARMQHEFAKIIWVHTIGVFLGVDQIDDGVLVDALRHRQLHDVAGAGRIGVKLLYDFGDLFECCVGRQLLLNGVHTDFSAIGMLSGNIFDGSGIGTNQDSSKTGVNPLLFQRCDSLGEIRFDLRGHHLSIDFHRHAGHSPFRCLIVVLAFACIVGYLGFSRKSHTYL